MDAVQAVILATNIVNIPEYILAQAKMDIPGVLGTVVDKINLEYVDTSLMLKKGEGREIMGWDIV